MTETISKPERILFEQTIRPLYKYPSRPEWEEHDEYDEASEKPSRSLFATLLMSREFTGSQSAAHTRHFFVNRRYQ